MTLFRWPSRQTRAIACNENRLSTIAGPSIRPTERLLDAKVAIVVVSRLLIRRGIPVWIEQNKPVGADQVESHAASLYKSGPYAESD